MLLYYVPLEPNSSYKLDSKNITENILNKAKAAFGVDFKQKWLGGCSFSELLVRKAYRKHNAYVLEVC